MIHRLDDKQLYVGSQGIDRVYLGGELLKSNDPPIYMATGEDFKRVSQRYVYIGSALEVDITDYVNRMGLTNLDSMFSGGPSDKATPVTKVVLGPNNVTVMDYMFYHSKVTSLDLSSFDTSNVTSMSGMFVNAQATILDLSSFDTSKVTNVGAMFSNAQATTGYARTQADADRLNSTSNKPFGLTFVVHPDLV